MIIFKIIQKFSGRFFIKLKKLKKAWRLRTFFEIRDYYQLIE